MENTTPRQEGWRFARWTAVGAMASSGVVMHTTPACLDNIKRRLVVRRWLPCADEGYGPLGSRSRTTGHNSETMPERGQPPPERLAHSTSTNKRNVIACSDRFHTVSPGSAST